MCESSLAEFVFMDPDNFPVILPTLSVDLLLRLISEMTEEAEVPHSIDKNQQPEKVLRTL